MATTSTVSASSLDGYFQISRRGSTPQRELRGGLATFFTMAYIIVLNPIILSSGADKFGHHLAFDQVAVMTAFTAGLMTLIMGLGGNMPVALAAGLGLNGVLAFQIAPTMSWPDAMGLVVLEGLLVCALVVSGLRKAIMDAIPMPLKQAISVGIGMFICFIGLVDAGFVSKPTLGPVPVGLGINDAGKLNGWPVLVFAFGVLLTAVLLTRKVPGAILISIVASTILAMILNAIFTIPALEWGTGGVPEWPDNVASTPDFGLFGNFSIFGGFAEAGVITALVFVFTLVLSDFFDTMGTVIGIGNEAGLLDQKGQLPNIGKVLFIDGAAAVAGGVTSCSSNTCYIESAAGVGEGARTGLSNTVIGALFGLAIFFTPIYSVVPSVAATPALVIVGFLLMTQVKDIPWDDYTIAIPAFLTIVLMPFSYSITNGIGAGFIAYVVIQAFTGKSREPSLLLWGTAVLFGAYFFLDPIERALGVT